MPVTVRIPFIFLPPPGVPPRRRRARLRFYVMNAIIAYLPSGDKKVIIPSAHRYFITSSPCLPRERLSLFVAPTSTSCFLITVEEVIMQLCASKTQ